MESNTTDQTKLENMLYTRELLIAGILYRQQALDKTEEAIAELRAKMEVKPEEPK